MWKLSGFTLSPTTKVLDLKPWWVLGDHKGWIGSERLEMKNVGFVFAVRYLVVGYLSPVSRRVE